VYRFCERRVALFCPEGGSKKFLRNADPFYKTVRYSIPEGIHFGAAMSTSHLTIKLPYTVSYPEDGGGMFV
jgi:hypothetical protein